MATSKNAAAKSGATYTMVLNHVYAGSNSKGDNAILWMNYLSKDGESRHLGRLHNTGFFSGGVSYWIYEGQVYNGKSDYKLDFVLNFPVEEVEKLYQELKKFSVNKTDEVVRSYVQLHIKFKNAEKGWKQVKEAKAQLKIDYSDILDIAIVSAEMPEHVKWEEEAVAAFKGGDFISQIFKPNKAKDVRVIQKHEIVDYANSQFVGTCTYKRMSAKSIISTEIGVSSSEEKTALNVNLELDVLD